MPRKITAQVVPFSSVVGSSVMLIGESGACIGTLALLNMSRADETLTRDEYKTRCVSMAQFAADKINGVS